jgi:hypothetical protein
VDLIARAEPSKPKELTIEAARYGPEKIEGQYALSFVPLNN